MDKKITGKGRAFLWAVESGLIPEINGCYETEQFDSMRSSCAWPLMVVL